LFCCPYYPIDFLDRYTRADLAGYIDPNPLNYFNNHKLKRSNSNAMSRVSMQREMPIVNDFLFFSAAGFQFEL